MAPEQPAPYPVQFSIDYPESSRRLTALFRIALAIPILILATCCIQLAATLALGQRGRFVL